MGDVSRDELLARLRRKRMVFRGEGVASMTLFGSRARGDHRSDSDVDLMIDLEPGKSFSLLDLAGLAQTIEADIGLSANIFLRRSLDPDFLEATLGDEVKVF